LLFGLIFVLGIIQFSSSVAVFSEPDEPLFGIQSFSNTGDFDACVEKLGKDRDYEGVKFYSILNSFDNATGKYTLNARMNNINNISTEIEYEWYVCRCWRANGNAFLWNVPFPICVEYWPDILSTGSTDYDDSCLALGRVNITLGPHEEKNISMNISQPNEEACGMFQADLHINKINENKKNKLGASGVFGLCEDCERNFCEEVDYDEGWLCMEDGLQQNGLSDYVVSLDGPDKSYFDNFGNNSICGNVTGHYTIDSGGKENPQPNGKLVLQTPELPVTGEYFFSFTYEREMEELKEDFSVKCGNKTYYFNDAAGPNDYMNDTVECNFNEGRNNVTFSSFGIGSVHLETFRVFNCGDEPFNFCEDFYCGRPCFMADWKNNEPDNKSPNDCTMVIISEEGGFYPKCVPTTCAD